MRLVQLAALGAAALLSAAARAEHPAGKAAEAAAQELAAVVPTAKPKIVQIAVPPFKEIGPAATGWGGLGAEMWAAKLAEVAKVKVLGPGKLAKLLNEQQVSALTGGKQAESAKLAGVQAVLAGEVMDQTDKVVVTVRLVGAATGAVFAVSKQSFVLATKGAKAAAEKPPEKAAEKPAEKPAEKASEAKPEKVAQPAAEQAPPPASDLPRAGGVESNSIEVVVRRLADRIAEAFARMPGNARYRRIAVVPFNDLGPNSKKHQIGAIVTAEIATDLRRDHGLLLVERAQMSQVMDELRFQQLTSDDAGKAGELGKLADAQALVLGSVGDVGDKYSVNVRVVSTSTGQTLAAEAANLPAAGMVSLASDSVVLRSRSGALFRSLIVPGWGQFYNRQTVKGALFLGSELAVLGSALAFHLTGNWAQSRYNENLPETSGHWRLAEDRYNWRNYMLYVAAAVWVANVVDAYVAGVDGDSALSGAVGERERTFQPMVSAGAGGAMVGGTLRF